MGEFIKLLYDLFKINSEEFYNDLLRLDFAVWVFFLIIGIGLAFTILYYYVPGVNRPKTAKVWVWCVFLFVTATICGIIGYWQANNTLVDNYTQSGTPMPDFSNDLVYFSIYNFIFGAIIFLIFSITLKYWSKNSSHIPF